MRKALIIIPLVILVSLVVVLVYLYFTKPAAPPPVGGGAALPPVATSTLPSGPTLSLGTPQGTVVVKNPYANPVMVNAEGDALVKRTSGYDLVYFPQDGSYLITLNNSPFASVRAQAESDFLATVGISQPDACKLKVAITVPYDINPSLAGQTFGLSFCENALK